MIAEPQDPDDAFEVLLRETVTQTVTSGLDREAAPGDDIIVRLLDYEMRGREERLSSQTIQVILSGRRLLGG